MPDSAADARAVITDEIEEHKRAIILLNRRLNTFTNVARLPAELLSEIFLEVCRDEYDKRQRALGAYYHFPRDRRWISVAHTCHSWRELALHTTGLWSYIVVVGKTSAENFLARSQNAPLSITAILNTQSDERVKAAEEIFVAHAARLKEVLLQGSSHTLHGLCQKLCTTAPLLESLTLSVPVGQYWTDGSPSISSNLSPETLPNLRTLDVRLVKYKWDQPIFCATLTKLIVRGRIEAHTTMGSFENLLTAIQNMTNLQTLELNEAIPRLTANTTSVPPPSRKITLAYLQRLSIVSSCRDCTNLLEHLSFPEDTSYQLSGRDNEGGRDLVNIFKDRLARSKPLHAIRLDRAVRTRHQIFAGRCTTSLLHIDDDFSSIPSEHVYLNVPANSPFTTPLFHDTNIFKNVQKLVIANHDEPWSWVEVFTGVPNIKFLAVTGDQAKEFTNALSTPHTSPSIKGSSSPTLLLPRLQVLELSDIRLMSRDGDLTPEFLDLLIDCLVTRCNYNMAVAELRLVHCVNTLSEDVDRLKEVVVDVVWDGVEDMEEDHSEEDFDEDEYGEDDYYDEDSEALYDSEEADEYDDGLFVY